MRNLVPAFVQEKLEGGTYSGDFSAAAMFVDVSGFTSMTEQLMRHGKVGAESISDILNTVFNPLIEAVYRNGGFVTGFAGDAFTAVFPVNDIKLCLISAMEIQKVFKEASVHKTAYGTFEIRARIGLSYGRVEWGIPGFDTHRTYYFKGEAIDGCAASEHVCESGGIACDEYFLHQIDSRQIEVRSAGASGYWIIDSLNMQGIISPAPCSERVIKGIAERFFAPQLYEQQITGEFRDIVPVFISFETPVSFEALSRFVSKVIETADLFCGYFNLLDFGDKGGLMLVLFGAPVSFENNVQRAVNFALEVHDNANVPVRFGITQGEVYAGFVGSSTRSTYTVLGDRVNLAARFMMKANWGEIWLSDLVKSKIEDKFEVRPLGEFQFKGKVEKITVYALAGHKTVREELVFSGEMIGREKELATCLAAVDPIHRCCSAGIISIYGDPGIGKTRLIFEIKKNLPFDANFHLLVADSMLRKSMNPFASFFERWFELDESSKAEVRKNAFEHKWQRFVDQLTQIGNTKQVQEVVAELTRTKSFLAALLGIEMKGSVYEQLDAKGRFDNTVYAVKEFFKAQSLLKPLVIAIDDIQWLDRDSHEIITQLFRKTSEFPIALITLGRYNDDGTKPVVNPGDTVSHVEIVLDKLPASEASKLLLKVLGAPAGEELAAFIFKRSEGNPFFHEQIALYLRDNNLLKLENNVYEAVSGDIEIPQEVNSLLVSRIDRLSRQLKEGVLTASVIGREIDTNILTEILESWDVAKLLEEGRQEQIWSAATEIIYIFRNLLLREAAYGMQLRAHLKSLHKTTADAIERVYGGIEKHYSDLAFHYDKADEVEKSKLYLRKAGDFAREHYQNEDAIRLYRRLLELLSTPEDLIDCRLKLASVYKLIGRWQEAEETYASALTTAKEIEDGRKIAESLCELGYMMLEKGRYDESRPILDDALTRYSELADKSGQLTVVGYIGLIYYYRGDLENAVEFFTKRLTLSRETGDQANLAVSFRYLGGVAYYRGDYVKAQEYYREVLKISETLQRELDIAIAKMNLGLSCSHLNDFDNALRYYKESLEVYQKFGSKFYLVYTHNNLGELHYWMGNHDDATKSFLEQRRIAAELGSMRHVAMANAMLGNVNKLRGDSARAGECYDRAIKIATDLSLKNLMCEFYYEKADLLYGEGNLSEAAKLNEEAIQIAEAVGRKDFLFKARVLASRMLAKHNPDAAAEALLTLAKEPTTTDQLASIYFHLYRFTNNEEYRLKAVAFYSELSSAAPRAKYRERLKELKPEG